MRDALACGRVEEPGEDRHCLPMVVRVDGDGGGGLDENIVWPLVDSELRVERSLAGNRSKRKASLSGLGVRESG